MDKPKKLILDNDVIPESSPVIQTGTKYFLDMTENKVFKQDVDGRIELLSSKQIENEHNKG